MKVKVRLYATLRQYMPGIALGESVEIVLPDGTTVGGLIGHLGIPPNEVKVSMVGGLFKEPDYVLEEGDDVALFPPIGGGVG